MQKAEEAEGGSQKEAGGSKRQRKREGVPKIAEGNREAGGGGGGGRGRGGGGGGGEGGLHRDAFSGAHEVAVAAPCVDDAGVQLAPDPRYHHLDHVRAEIDFLIVDVLDKLRL